MPSAPTHSNRPRIMRRIGQEIHHAIREWWISSRAVVGWALLYLAFAAFHIDDMDKEIVANAMLTDLGDLTDDL